MPRGKLKNEASLNEDTAIKMRECEISSKTQDKALPVA